MKQTAVTPVILGLLSLGPRSGYDIKTVVDRSTRFFWAASYGQIYPELRRLEDEGLIEGEDAVERRARPARLRADRGRPGGARARGCSARPPRSSSATSRCCGCSSPTTSRASRRSACSRPAGAGTRSYLEILHAIAALPGGKDPDFVDLVLRWGIDFNEWGAQWCQEQLERLQSEKTTA